MKKILVIEDEPAFSKLIHETLVRNGYDALDAVTGKTGLELSLSEHPSLIILDIKLPDMDGLTVLDHLRQDAWGKTAKVIVLTNLDPNDDILKKILEYKPDYYFVKSNIKLAELMERVKGVIS